MNAEIELYKLAFFLIYTLVYEALIWGLFSYGVFFNGLSPWWFILAAVMSGAQLQPSHFGLPYNPKLKSTNIIQINTGTKEKQ